MKRFPFAFWVFAIGLAVSFGQIFLLGPLLPDRVASHFGPTGHADGFMQRNDFLVFQGVLTGFVALLFAALPALIRLSPNESINLPYKAYWLAPERRDSTLAYLADRLFAFGAATLTLLVSVLQMVYEANLVGILKLGGTVWLYLVIYLGYTVIWSLALHRRFVLPPGNSTLLR